MQPLVFTPTQTIQHEIDPNFPQFHLDKIPWPDLEGYDVHHGLNTAKLALVILSYEFPNENNSKNQRTLWCAALLHDLGRQNSFRLDDPHCAEQSAKLAEQVMRNPQHGIENDKELHEVVCRLVAELGQPNQNDPLSKALHDADAYEYTRFRPGTYEGHALVKKHTAPERLYTAWAQSRNNLKRYMAWRGWR